MATIIEQLQADKNYLNYCNQALSTPFNTIDIDCSKGEMDRICIIYLPKSKYSFIEAMSMLTLKQKMLNEEWEDIELYDAKDVALWTTILAKEYKASTYKQNIDAQDFLNDDLVKRLQIEDKQYEIFANDKQINFVALDKINPCKTDFIKISKSDYSRLEVEYYIETQNNYVLFNWYTNA